MASELEIVIQGLKNSSSEGKRFAAQVFTELTSVGIDPMKVKALILDKKVTNENDLKNLVASIANYRLREDNDFMNLNTNRGIQIKAIYDPETGLEIGDKYSISQFRIFILKIFRLEMGEAFDERYCIVPSEKHEVLDYIKVFFDVKKDLKTGKYSVLGKTDFKEYFKVKK